MKSDRRKYNRYVPPNNTFAALGPNFTTVGRVREISLGGVGLEYITDRSLTGNPAQVDIFLSENGFHLSKIPCRVVYDLHLSPPPPDEEAPFITKKCGLAFGPLLENQTSQLKDFLETKTLGLSV
ncbi:MAG: PilZ domain-containing protein [Deltaproteobacteria bacterium]|nr:PilZ domain-containing protein [Deltaproteobacteria bacterium]